MEERQSRLSSMVWRRLRPYFCVRLILLNSMFSNFCHVLKKLGLNTKEIANLTNKSVRGVESGKFRLKKKLDLDTSKDIYDYLLEIEQS